MSGVAEHHRRALGRPKSDLVEEALARHPHRSAELVEIQVAARLRTRPAAFEVLRPPNPDYREVVAAIDIPTLLVIGDDPVVTPHMAAELHRLNPRVHVEPIPDAGHGLPFQQPERLAEVVLAFLHDLVPRGESLLDPAEDRHSATPVDVATVSDTVDEDDSSAVVDLVHDPVLGATR